MSIQQWSRLVGPLKVRRMEKITGITLPENRGTRFFRAMNRSFDVKSASEKATISIYEDIGMFGISASDMRRELDALSSMKEIDLRINSPGGDVFDGIAIYNDLVEHPAKINVKVTGMAASAASVIAMAGDTVEMAENSFLMIHNAWALSIGDKQTMDEMSEMLGKIDGSLVKTYANRTGNKADQVEEWMNAETWFTANEAKDNGFIDSVTGEEKAQALFDLSIYNNVPGRLKREIEAGLREAGYSQREAKAAIKDGFPQRDAGGKHRDGDDQPTLLQAFTERLSA